MFSTYFKQLYARTMEQAYKLAYSEMGDALVAGGECLDCGASDGHAYRMMNSVFPLPKANYHGIEWNENIASAGIANGLAIVQGDLNDTLPYPDNKFRLVIGLSVLEHLLNPCRYMRECYRVLEPGGTLVLLTPNISTLFTAALILAGRMPSSGPHPDSDALVKGEELFTVTHIDPGMDKETDTPRHRHLVVFSYIVLRRYLRMLGFSKVRGHGFGLYPFPNFMQPALERLDPYHCHQMVFIAKK